MKKIFKIFIYNTVIFIILFMLLNFLAHCTTNIMPIGVKSPYDILIGLSKKSEEKTESHYLYEAGYRPVENINSNKRPIVILGCSYAYGDSLKDNETFSYQLGKLTKRPVYNRAASGWGIKEIFYILNKKNFYNIVSNNNSVPEYIIYVYILDHINRMHALRNPWENKYAIFYDYDKESETFHRNYFYEYMVQIPFLYVMYNHISSKHSIDEDYITEFKSYLKEVKKEIRKNLGNDVKFVMLLYEPETLPQDFYLLQEKNFIILDAKDVAGVDLYKTEYQISEQDKHPNAKAWEILTPKLVEKLGIK